MTEPSLREVAASWVLLHEFDEMTPAKLADFDEWISASDEARGAYRHAQNMWRLAANPSIDRDGTTPRSIYRDGPRRTWHSRRWAGGALAAGVALVFLTVPQPFARFVDIQLARTRGGGQVIDTGASRGTSTRLADGSVVTLDTGTRMRVLEMGERRRIELLSGHAFFQVAKDPSHPFLVTASNKTVHALGTAFDVRVEPDAVAITLVEGRVRVDQPRGLLRDPIAADMTPGKQLIASNDQVWMMTPVSSVAATMWLRGRLSYNEETVGKIVADVNEGSHRKIVFIGPVDEEQRLVGVFGRGDVDTLATVLEVKGIAHTVARSSDKIEMEPSEALGERKPSQPDEEPPKSTRQMEASWATAPTKP